MLDIYVAMVIGDRSKTRDFSDQVALDRCKDDVRTAITYVLGWVEAAAPEGLNEEAKHRTIMQQLMGMPIEMLDKTYNRYRMENHGINLRKLRNSGSPKQVSVNVRRVTTNVSCYLGVNPTGKWRWQVVFVVLLP